MFKSLNVKVDIIQKPDLQSKSFDWFLYDGNFCVLWRRGRVVIATAQFHSTKPELRFYAGSNPARGVSEIRDGEDL